MREHGCVTTSRGPALQTADRRSRSRLLAAAAGVLTGLAGVAVSEATASLVRLRLSPPYAVAEAVIEVTPGDLALDLIHIFGRWDKPLLLVGVAVALLLLSALAGVLAVRRLWWGHLVFLGTAVVGLLAVMTRPGVGAVAVLPVALGAATWVLVLGGWSTRWSTHWSPRPGRRTGARSCGGRAWSRWAPWSSGSAASWSGGSGAWWRTCGRG